MIVISLTWRAASLSDRVLVMSNGSIKGEFLAKDATFDKIMALAVQK